jgi:TonB-linked SusC/RagA family outer membrane protein
VNYVYDSKYLFEANFRYDGSVRFAPSRRWGFFPSVSLGWRMSEENFFKDNIRFIDYLKLKGSIGLLGNDAVGGWQWMQRYNLTTGAQYGTTSYGIQPNVLPNPDITWEKSLTYNAGFDANFLNNKLTSNFEFFYKHTYDVLGSRIATLPASFGANMPNENYGIVDSKGFEMELSYEDKIGDNFTYRIGGNLGYAVNKLIRKDEAENLRAYQSEIGLNTDHSWGYVATDIIRTQAELDALPADYTIFGAKPELGMLNYQDIRGAVDDVPDGKIDSNDRGWVSKHTTPPVNYGFSLGANWKGLALDLFFQGVGKYDVMMTNRSPGTGNVTTEYSFWKDHWTPENPDAASPRPYRHQAGEASSFWLMNGAFLRLKNLTLSYSLPKSTLSKAGVSQLKVFFVGTNLFLLEDHIKYFDPEIGNTAENIRCFPIMKSYSLGVNLSF